jgi:hypothetical protein
VLKLNPKVVIGNGQNSQPLVAKFPVALLPDFGESDLQKLVLQQNNREHDVLECIFVAV